MIARTIIALCLFEASYAVAYQLGMSFSEVTASPFWLPDSVLLCALLLAPRRWWWVFVLGALPVRLSLSAASGLPLWFLFGTFALDSAKGVVTALALRHFLPEPLRLSKVRDYAAYCLIAVALVPSAAAFAGAGMRSLLGHDYWQSWQQWFLGDALTNLVITPVILYGLPGAAKSFVNERRSQWLEGLIVVLGLALTSYFAFETEPIASGFADPRFFAPIPFMFWAALRFGIPGASGAIIIIAVASVEAALAGHGPFSGRSPADTVLALQEFLLLRAAPLYLVGVLIELREAAEIELAHSERRYREVVASQTELMCRFLADGTLSFVSEVFCRAFRRERDVLMGTDFLALMSEPSREIAREQIALAAARGERGEWEFQALIPGENLVWQHWTCHSICGADGQVLELQAIGRDVTDRKRADEADRSLSGKLIEAQEQERSRIARDLHDDVNQRLASASMELSAIRRAVQDECSRAKLDHLRDELIALSELVRHISHGLHPTLLRHTGLSTALSTLCGAQRHRSGPCIDLRVPSSDYEIPADIELCLYRAAQEALTNAIRHAKASRVELDLRVSNDCAQLDIEDDGVGLIGSRNNGQSRGLGLLSLDERTKLLGGSFALTSQPGRGVRVCIRIPLPHGTRVQPITKPDF